MNSKIDEAILKIQSEDFEEAIKSKYGDNDAK